MTIQEMFDANNGFLEAKELTSRTQWNQLNRMLEQGLAVRIKRGHYAAKQDSAASQRVEVARMIPSGIFCLFTAWNYHQLTTNNPFEFHVAIGSRGKVTLPDYPPVKIYYWTDKSYLLGISEVTEGNHIIKIYDLEKSVCDAVRYRNKTGMDTASEILKNYLKRQDRDLDKLMKYAAQLRIGNVIENLIIIML